MGTEFLFLRVRHFRTVQKLIILGAQAKKFSTEFV